MEQAVAGYASRLGEKLRRHKLETDRVTVSCTFQVQLWQLQRSLPPTMVSAEVVYEHLQEIMPDEIMPEQLMNAAKREN